MDDKKLWLKIRGRITYYFKSYNRKLSNEELWVDYVEYALPHIEEDGVLTYLDKQILERVVVDATIMDKAKVAFIESNTNEFKYMLKTAGVRKLKEMMLAKVGQFIKIN